MSEISSNSASNRDVRTYEYKGIQVYGRKGPDGAFTELDSIDGDEKKIREIADFLQRRGYGVMRQRQARAGRVYELFKATWIGIGPPPDDPFAPNTETTTGARQMKSKLIHDNEGERTFALIFEAGDEAMAGLREFARQHQLGAAVHGHRSVSGGNAGLLRLAVEGLPQDPRPRAGRGSLAGGRCRTAR